MVKLIIGLKGSGKTKTLIDLANAAIPNSEAPVVVITKGPALMHQIKWAARLINVDDYDIDSSRSLYGMLAGISATNHDIHEIFIDGIIRIACHEPEIYERLILSIAKLAEKNNMNVYITLSKTVEELPDSLHAFV